MELIKVQRHQGFKDNEKANDCAVKESLLNERITFNNVLNNLVLVSTINWWLATLNYNYKMCQSHNIELRPYIFFDKVWKVYSFK